MTFVSELKRRKVFQVAAVYLVVAWLIMQVVDVVNEPLNLPDWFDTVAILLLAIGFPIAVIASWAFDLTPEGVVKDQGTVQSGGRRMEYVFMGLLVVAVGTLLYREFTPPEQAVEAVAEEAQRDVLPNSIAVLPFENLSPDPDDEYFAAGIHDELLTQLAKVGDLMVIARTSVLGYPNSGKTIEEIAGELNVETVMEGTVRYAGNLVRITAQLIDPITGGHLWAETYEREFSVESMFAIESDIATNIAMALEAELLPSEQRDIATPVTTSTRALLLYLRALEMMASLSGSATEEGRAQLHRYLDEAILADPEFALAHALKASDFATAMFVSGEGEIRDDLERSVFEQARRALELDPNVGLAHAALATVHRVYGRSEERREALERAIELSPNDPEVLSDWANFVSNMGQHDEAIATAQRVAELAPSSGHL